MMRRKEKASEIAPLTFSNPEPRYGGVFIRTLALAGS